VRTFISFPAGIAQMPLRRFVAYSTLGAAIWSTLLVGAGALLGAQWETLRASLAPVDTLLVVIVVVALIMAVAWRLGLLARFTKRR
jgi:uncharacterized membrane protein YdjX (TVP38/TMEM64 family)